MKNNQDLERHSRFSHLLAAISQGDPEASSALINEYGGHIRRAVRRHINSRIRDRFDSEDFSQDVWKSFFSDPSAVEKVKSEDDLISFLVSIASHKVIDAGRKTQRRPEQNQIESEFFQKVSMDQRRRVSQPTPSQFAVASEQLALLKANEDDREIRMLEKRLDGETQAQVAKDMGLSERHVRRVLDRLNAKCSDNAG